MSSRPLCFFQDDLCKFCRILAAKQIEMNFHWFLCRKDLSRLTAMVCADKHAKEEEEATSHHNHARNIGRKMRKSRFGRN